MRIVIIIIISSYHHIISGILENLPPFFLLSSLALALSTLSAYPTRRWIMVLVACVTFTTAVGKVSNGAVRSRDGTRSRRCYKGTARHPMIAEASLFNPSEPSTGVFVPENSET